jgi:hypothetical protein
MVLETRDNTWIVDFGANTHVTTNAKVINEVKKLIDQYNVKIAIEESHVVYGKVMLIYISQMEKK